MADLPSLDGRRFSASERAGAGDAGPETVFLYHQDEELIWASYRGGAVRLGFLVGTRTGDSMEFRYSHLDADGQTASGWCRSEIRADPSGRITLQETWQWESRRGRGTSVLYEQEAT